MKKLFMGLLLLILIFNFALAGGLSLNNGLSNRQKMDAFMQFGGQEKSQDTVSYSFEKSPALAFMMSAVVPGAGQFYADKKWWSAGFLGVEALGWGLWYNRKTYGEDMEDEYEQFANSNWSFNKWLGEWISNPDLYGQSHEINVILVDEQGDIIEGSVFTVDEDYYETKDEMFNEFGSQNPDGVIEVKSRDYYENIGKYDQFAAGWSDYDPEANPDTVLLGGMRKNYVNKRDDSNQALKMATKSLTVVMFNHLFSALHAQFAAKHYSDDASKPKEMSWNLSLTPGYRRGQLVSGINLSFAF